MYCRKNNIAVRTILQEKQYCSKNNIAVRTMLQEEQYRKNDNIAGRTILHWCTTNSVASLYQTWAYTGDQRQGWTHLS